MRKFKLHFDDRGYQCCFCAQGIERAGDDPCFLILHSSSDHDAEQEMYCHAECLKKAVHLKFPLMVALDN